MATKTTIKKIMSNRIEWLDVAKGITIVLMVLGHTSIPDVLSRIIFAFHMPLFFIASGWTTNWTKLSFGKFVLKKRRTILLPFFLYSAVVLLVMCKAMDYDVIKWLTRGWGGYALWFIPVLFVSSLIGRLVWLQQNKYIRWLLMLLLIFVGAGLRYYDIWLPWTLSSVPYASFLVLLGTELKQYIGEYIEKPCWWLMIICLIVTIGISHFWKLDLAWNNILPVLPLTIGAVSGTLIMFIFSSFIMSKTRVANIILKKIGEETFAIVAFSQIIIMLLNEYTSLNAIIRYSILILIMVFIVFIKNRWKYIFNNARIGNNSSIL